MNDQRPESICCAALGTATCAQFQAAFQRLMFSVAHETSVHAMEECRRQAKKALVACGILLWSSAQAWEEQVK